MKIDDHLIKLMDLMVNLKIDFEHMIDIHNIDLKEFFYEDKIINHLLDED
jgi:hypothetical protein